MTRPLLDWGAATLAVPGESESGDRYAVRNFPEGVLVAVVDGLGHGEEAVAAAEIAVREIKNSGLWSVIPLIKHCHARLRDTRGVVMSAAFFNALEETMTWLSVGNVEGVLLRVRPGDGPGRESLVLRGGVVGSQLPPLYAAILSLVPGDTLVLATDGVHGGFYDGINLRESPQRNADRILAQCSRGTDDALVFVARYKGKVP